MLRLAFSVYFIKCNTQFVILFLFQTLLKLFLFKVDSRTKYKLDKIAMGSLILFFLTIQFVFIGTLFKSYQKIKLLQKEELAFERYIASYPYDLEEYDV